MRYFFILILLGVSAKAFAQSEGQASSGPDAALFAILSENENGLYIQNSETHDVAFVQKASVVNPKRRVRIGEGRCVFIANGTLCETHGVLPGPFWAKSGMSDPGFDPFDPLSPASLEALKRSRAKYNLEHGLPPPSDAPLYQYRPAPPRGGDPYDMGA